MKKWVFVFLVSPLPLGALFEDKAFSARSAALGGALVAAPDPVVHSLKKSPSGMPADLSIAASRSSVRTTLADSEYRRTPPQNASSPIFARSSNRTSAPFE